MHIVLEYSSKSNVDIICYYNVFECRIKICCQISGWQFYRVEDNTKKGSSQLLSLMVIFSWDPSTESCHLNYIPSLFSCTFVNSFLACLLGMSSWQTPQNKTQSTQLTRLSFHRDDHYEKFSLKMSICIFCTSIYFLSSF